MKSVIRITILLPIFMQAAIPTIPLENPIQYPCLVKEAKDTTRGVLKKVYFCYKFNSAKTRAKSVTIKLIYTKSPNLPKKYKSLASQYTYKDLQKRAQRTLDSLYIKDGW